MSVFDEIKTGLTQAIAYEKGELKANIRILTVTPVEEFSAAEIKAIRKKAGLTQVLFAGFLGVSPKTVEAWEAGRNRPSGIACRLLSLTKSDPLLPVRSGFISKS